VTETWDWNVMADHSKNTAGSLEKTFASMAPDIPEEVTSWLGRLVLLYGVPFHYMIPEEEMLPRYIIPQGATLPQDKGSLRFFFLDPIWIQCLVQGACSVGSNGYGDRIIDKAMNEWMQPNQPNEGKTRASLANKKAAGVRDRLREQYEAVPMPREDACLGWPLTGFLLRSPVVEGWRGLEVMAYRDLTVPEKQELTAKLSGTAKGILEEAAQNEAAQNKVQRDRLRSTLRDFLRKQKPEELQQLLTLTGVQTQEALLKLLVELVTPLKPLRIEQLAGDVMLAIFNGIIAQLVIRQPQEGLHFGLTKGDNSYSKTLRELGYKNSTTAGEILQDTTIDLATGELMRDVGRGVINIKKLAKKMKDQLSNLGQLKPDEKKPNNFTSAEFAVEMIEAAGEFTYLPRIKTSS
jgi:hypothetical protein